MHKYTNSQLPITFNNYFELITDVHPYDMRQTNTRQFALSKPSSKSSSKIIKWSAIEIWPEISLEIKNKPC